MVRLVDRKKKLVEKKEFRNLTNHFVAFLLRNFFTLFSFVSHAKVICQEVSFLFRLKRH